MAADMHIHILTDDVTDEDLRCFFSSTLGHPLGISLEDMFFMQYKCLEREAEELDVAKKHKQLDKEFPNESFSKGTILDHPKEVQKRWDELLKEHYEEFKFTCSHFNKVQNTPSVWVGEVSWLKASLFEDGNDVYVPSPIMKISEIIDEDNKGKALINDDFISKIENAFDLKNTTGYSIEQSKTIVDFLNLYKGKYCFTVSW